MRSSRFWRSTGCVLFSLALGSCGVMGNRADLTKLLDYSPESVGCLNQAGARAQAYYKGNIDAGLWASTWDCAIGSLDLFKKFVKSSVAEGYTREDIKGLLETFLLAGNKITPELVSALFDLKASIFGGTNEIITLEEIDHINDFIRVLKAETMTLHPLMVKRAHEPTAENLLALTDALTLAGDSIANALVNRGNTLFAWSSAQTFVNEIAKMMQVEMPPDGVMWLSTLKMLLTSGTHDGIEATMWPFLVRSAISYGGPALAIFSIDSRYLKGPNAAGEFGMQLAWKIKTSILQTLALYGGALPLKVLDELIDSLPHSALTIDRKAVKNVLRPLTQKMLMSRVPDAIDSSAIDLLFEKIDFWVRGQTHLERIFERMNAGPAGVTSEQFADEAARYLDDEVMPKHRNEVYRLILLARHIRPMFMTGDAQITFTAMETHTLDNLSKFHWIRLLGEQLLAAYSTVPGKLKASLQDLKTIVDDYTEIGYALRVIDPTVPDLYIKRFREANLFTVNSNGDDTMDLDEATPYIGMLASAGTLSAKLRAGTDAVCEHLGQDNLGYNWKSANCFRNEVFGKFRIYFDHMPYLVRFYEGMTDAEKHEFHVAFETGARFYGYSDQPIASTDQDGFAGLAQYVESFFSRFDTNQSGTLSLDEVMRAYPIFKGSLAELGKIDPSNDFLLETIFTYTVKFGHPPTTDFWGYAELISWIGMKPFWVLSADRLGFFKVIASISQPAPIPTAPQNPAPPLRKWDYSALSDWRDPERAMNASFVPAWMFTPRSHF